MYFILPSVFAPQLRLSHAGLLVVVRAWHGRRLALPKRLFPVPRQKPRNLAEGRPKASAAATPGESQPRPASAHWLRGTAFLSLYGRNRGYVIIARRGGKFEERPSVSWPHSLWPARRRFRPCRDGPARRVSAVPTVAGLLRRLMPGFEGDLGKRQAGRGPARLSCSPLSSRGCWVWGAGGGGRGAESFDGRWSVQGLDL